jgi:hypothetical protein
MDRLIRLAACCVLFLALFSGEPATAQAPVVLIHGFDEGLAGIRAASPDVRLSVGRDAGASNETVLIVDYPAPTGNPAGRDVQCDAQATDWSGGRAIAFRIKSPQASRISVSFIDRNRVVYTSWIDLKGGDWEPVRIPFETIRPNPYFQPPDAKKGAPIDVSDVKFVAFAPQDKAAGRLTIDRFVLAK